MYARKVYAHGTGYMCIATRHSAHTSDHTPNCKAWRTRHLSLRALQLQLQDTVFFAEIHHNVVHHASGFEGGTLVLLLPDLVKGSRRNMHQSGTGDKTLAAVGEIGC